MTAAVLQLDGAVAQADSVIAENLSRLREIVALDVVLPRLISTAIVLLLAFVTYRLIRVVIRRFVSRDIDEDDPVTKRLRKQRAETLGSLFGNVALVVIAVITILTILNSFFNIGPILASVGVLGLAISFGAQSLVKDVISGTFLLLEGQFGIGDVVSIGGVSGMVERITLRTVTLRDIQGVVHIIPNGEITTVSNMTKGWSRAVLDVGVAYREDVDRVMDVLRDIGAELHADPEWGPLLVEPPEVPGVEAFADSAVVIRLLVKTLPLQQWNVARQLRRRIKKRFDAENIEIPFPHITFYWGDGQQPEPPAPRPGAAAVAAARRDDP
jgi:small-conductance mechanosensitive channel